MSMPRTSLVRLMDAAATAATPPCRQQQCVKLGTSAVAIALIVAALCLLLNARPGGSASLPAGSSFVSVRGLQFEASCRAFYIAGFNCETLAQAPAARAGRRLQPGEPSGRRKVRQLFHQAADAGLNVVRTWAHTSDPHGEWVLQVRPGEYNEEAFRALDWVVAEAGRAGLRLILSLVDNWSYRGGIDEFVDWSPSTPLRDQRFPPILKEGDATPDDHYSPEHQKYENQRHALFFSDLSCRGMYRGHMQAVMRRRNVYTGLQYRHDPAIMAWDLVNELRCSVVDVHSCPRLVNSWVREMSDYARSLTPHQLITVGSDGFWAGEAVGAAAQPQPDAPQGLRQLVTTVGTAGEGLAAQGRGQAYHNPGTWAGLVGQDFVQQHSLPNISYSAIHTWPQQWQVEDPAFSTQWLQEHMQAAAGVLRKPLLVSEFGKKLGRGQDPPEAVIQSHRNPVFNETYALTEAAFADGQAAPAQHAGAASVGGATSSGTAALAGTLFWRWAFNVYPSDAPGPHGVSPSHSTFALVTAHARRVAALNAVQPPRAECGLGCWVAQARLGSLLRSCRQAPEICKERRFGQSDGCTPTYPSRAECCQPGLGAFRRGCSVPW